MPNYLTKATGRPNAAPTGGKNDYHLDDMYKTRVFNADYSIDFEGKMPEDFALALSGNWGEGLQAAMQDVQSAVLGSAERPAEYLAQAAGISTRNKIMTARTWEQPAYLSFSLPIGLTAYGNTQEEVIIKLRKLLKLTAPKMGAGGLTLQSPGPVPAKLIAEQFGSVGHDLASQLKGEILTVQVGTFFTMTPIIIQNVSANFDGLMEHGTGNPISVSVILEIESYFAVTAEDIDLWLHGDLDAESAYANNEETGEVPLHGDAETGVA